MCTTFWCYLTAASKSNDHDLFMCRRTQCTNPIRKKLGLCVKCKIEKSSSLQGFPGFLTEC